MVRIPSLDFEEHFRAQYPKLVSELDFILGDLALARDVAQDAFIKEYVSWARVSRLDKPGAWVRKVAIRMAIRTRRRLFRSAPLDDAQEVESSTIDTDRELDVRNAISQLTKTQRAAIVFHYYRDYPVAELAPMLGCSESTAKVHLHQARQRLATLLVQYRP